MTARAASPRLAVGLYRVSTAEQGQSGLGLEAQQASVRAFVAAQGWVLVAEHSYQRHDVLTRDGGIPLVTVAVIRCLVWRSDVYGGGGDHA